MFGMKNAIKRQQLGSPGAGSFRYYASPEDSVKDYLIYLDFVGFPDQVDSPEMFVNELKKRNYFEESESFYLQGLKSWL
jgi:hypothetical protein